MARLLAEVPNEEHKYLKMCCAQLGMTMKSFITAAIIEKVERQEDNRFRFWGEIDETA